MTHTPSLAVYSNRQLLDELYRRVAIDSLTVELLRSGEGFAQIEIGSGKGQDRYAFEALAYLKKIAPVCCPVVPV